MTKRYSGITLEDFGLHGEGRSARMRRVADVILAEWSSEARSELNTLAIPYVAALAIREVTDNTCIVSLPGPGADSKVAVLARMAELGMGPSGIGSEGRYDIRKFVLKAGTNRLHFGKNGPFVHVPFDMSDEDMLNIGGKALRDLAQSMTPTVTKGKKTVWGDRLTPKFTRTLIEAKVGASIAALGRVSGAVRLASTYSKGKGGKAEQQTTGYRAWRTMSWAGEAWWHPGIKAARLADRIRRQVPELVEQAL